MSNNELMSLSTCTEYIESPSKSVTKVQKLPNMATWNDTNAVLRDYIKSFFSKRTPILRLKHEMPTRKRVIILTSDDVLLVYETNCTGYSFDIRSALKMKTSSNGHFEDAFEKACVVTLKYKFGSVNLVLVNTQISVWRRTLSTIFEGECFDRSLLTDLSIYTAKDEDESFPCNTSAIDGTGSVVSLKSVRGQFDLSPTDKDLTLDETQMGRLYPEKTNSNRSLTYLPTTIRSSASRPSLVSIDSNKKPNIPQNRISIRQGSRCVSYLAKKFEQKLGSIGKKASAQVPLQETTMETSSPLECLFPPLPIQKLQEDNLKSISSRNEKTLQVSKLDFTPSQNGKKLGEEIVVNE